MNYAQRLSRQFSLTRAYTLSVRGAKSSQIIHSSGALITNGSRRLSDDSTCTFATISIEKRMQHLCDRDFVCVVRAFLLLQCTARNCTKICLKAHVDKLSKASVHGECCLTATIYVCRLLIAIERDSQELCLDSNAFIRSRLYYGCCTCDSCVICSSNESSCEPVACSLCVW